MTKQSNTIKANDLVKVKVIGNNITLHKISTCNKQQRIKRITGHRHINLKTGEIKADKRNTARGDNMPTLLASQVKLQDLIKANTVDIRKILYITLTYAEKQFDINLVNKDFKGFIRRLRRTFTNNGQIEYVNTFETTSDTSGYHIHAILFFNQANKSVYLPLETLNDAWQKGFTSIGKPKSKNEVYHYLTPHLVNEVTDKNRHMHKKALRIIQMPAGANLYHYSKGLQKPTIYTDTYENIKQYLQDNAYTYAGERFYKNPMPAFNGNTLYYYKEHYVKDDKPDKPKRTRI